MEVCQIVLLLLPDCRPMFRSISISTKRHPNQREAEKCGKTGHVMWNMWWHMATGTLATPLLFLMKVCLSAQVQIPTHQVPKHSNRNWTSGWWTLHLLEEHQVGIQWMGPWHQSRHLQWGWLQKNMWFASHQKLSSHPQNRGKLWSGGWRIENQNPFL